MFSLVYVSAAATDLTRPDLVALVESSRRHNAAAGITGVLLLRHGTFLQMLEGRRDDVERVFAAIEGDARHHEVVVVRRREQPTRDFPKWTMGFGDVDPGSTDPVSVEMPPPGGPVVQTEAEAAFVRDLLALFDS